LAYQLHQGTTRLRRTLMEINISAAYREKLSRRVFDWVKQAQLLGTELDPSNENAFLYIENTETECEKLGVL